MQLNNPREEHSMPQLKYLTNYSPEVIDQVQKLISEGKLGSYISSKYPDTHQISSSKLLYEYAMGIKNQFMRKSAPLSKAIYCDKVRTISHALGTLSYATRVQGNKLKTKHEIRIAALFRKAPAAFLRMIVVHELAHLKEKAHDKSFYSLCTHMEPDYMQLEFDLRLYLTHLEIDGKAM